MTTTRVPSILTPVGDVCLLSLGGFTKTRVISVV